ncbi:hypothetical protein ACFVVL_30870 [Kitasatospora sp. NPDC058115]|uniref:hypothetical protein n=1 Tax=Kitasatospora sp. NPDC058115 TaxID=3346347 RepID=UPI0036DB6876
MSNPRRLRARPDDDRWNTRPVRARVLAVVRTLTSATRVLEVLAPLRELDGIGFAVTVNPGSAFTAGLDDHLRAQPGLTVLPWREAVRQRFDLAVACAVHASMHRLRAPLVVLPHGAGYNRLVPESTGDTVTAAGLSRHELTHRGRVFPAVIGLSHREQFDRLRAACPEALPRAREVGDPCFDRMLGGLGARDGHRTALGAVDGRRLVVVTSTWSGHSLLGRHPGLPLRLVEQLPADEYTVAAVLHPNVWARHDLRALLAPAERRGLRLVPPDRGWQAALIAADCVIGDHGSVSFYAAALERRTLLVATGAAELDPRSPTYAFGRAAPALDPDGDLLTQLERAAAEQDPAALRPVTDRSLGRRGESARILREIFLSYLPGIEAPPGDPLPLPHPRPVPLAAERPTAYDVVATGEGTAIHLRRYPVGPGRPTARGFLAVADDEPSPVLRRTADVLARTGSDTEQPAEAWLAATAGAAELPRLTVAVAALGPDHHLLRLPGGLLLEARADRPWGTPVPRLDPLLLGSAVAHWLTTPAATPTALPHRTLTLHTGPRRTSISFTTRPGHPDGPAIHRPTGPSYGQS